MPVDDAVASAFEDERVRASSHVICALSGGVDSTALAIALHKYTPGHDINMIAVTVDHGLREESTREAQHVGRWCEQIGIRHIIATIKDAPPQTGNTQSWARERRYAALEDISRQHGNAPIMLAHHMDDQAETVIMRLARGSGIDGMGGMSAYTEHDGILRVRPFLRITKAELREYVIQAGHKWVEDASNGNMSYTRNRLRGALDDAFSASPDERTEAILHISATARAMQRAADYLRMQTLDFTRRYMHIEGGTVTVPLGEFVALHEEIALRVLQYIIRHVAGDMHLQIREEKLQRLLTKLHAAKSGEMEARKARHQLEGSDISLTRRGDDYDIKFQRMI